jgi:hypothetical protein
VRLTIPLSQDSGDRLRQLAAQECRDPQMQAKYLLECALRHAPDPAAVGRKETPDSVAVQS